MSNQKISKEIYQLLNGENLGTKQHEAMMLLTMTEDFWPHIAMISVGEIVALDCNKLRLALWPNTITTHNILRTSQATFVVFFAGKAHYIRLSLQRLTPVSNARHIRERFSAAVVSVREDTAKYADITSGVKISLKDSDTVIKRWYETIEELLR
ncbi:hypothetical protein J2S09_003853 [Bacillus fengqiuensis]|nr:hypothetical protein [Bacillus fengqiuensis]